MLAGLQRLDNVLTVGGTGGEDGDGIDLLGSQSILKGLNDLYVKLLGVLLSALADLVANIDLLHDGVCLKQGHEELCKTAAANKANRHFLIHYLLPPKFHSFSRTPVSNCLVLSFQSSFSRNLRTKPFFSRPFSSRWM